MTTGLKIRRDLRVVSLKREEQRMVEIDRYSIETG